MNENNTPIDAEIEEAEIEALPESGGLVTTGKNSINEMLTLADNIDRMIEAQNKIRSAFLKLAQPSDWVLFGDGNGGKAEIGFAGAMRIGSTLGVNFTNWEGKKESGRDDIGEWYRWEYECDVSYSGRIVRVYGRAGSRDKFFGKMKGEYRPLHEIDEGNIKIVALRSAMKEGVKVLFGLHHMDPEFLKKYGIRLDSAGGHSFKNQDQKAEEAQSVTVQISEITMKKGDKWTRYSVKDVEGGIYTTFNETLATEAKRAKESQEPAALTYVKDQYGLKLLSINGVTSSKE